MKPLKLCSQNFSQVTCVKCTFINLTRTDKLKDTCVFLNFINQISLVENQPIQKLYDKTGLSPKILPMMLEHYNVPYVTFHEIQPVKYGWVVFEAKLHSKSFHHVVAIYDGFVIDSYNLPNNFGGVYKWDGKIFGYQYATLVELVKITDATNLFKIKDFIF